MGDFKVKPSHLSHGCTKLSVKQAVKLQVLKYDTGEAPMSSPRLRSPSCDARTQPDVGTVHTDIAN